MILDKRERRILYLTILVAIGALFYVFIAEPGLRGWQSKERKIQKRLVGLERDRAVLKSREEVEKEYSGIKRRMKLEKESKKVIPELILGLGKMAESIGVRIENLTPLEVKKLSFYSDFSVEVALESNLDSLVRFLYKLKTYPFILDVRRLALSPKGDDPSVLKGELVISTVFLKE